MKIERDFIRPGRSVAVGVRGMAATSHPAATLAAVEMLKAGGNAVDAALAAVAVQCVVDPHMTGIGGDCFALVAPPSGKIVSYNGSGRAPAKADIEALLAQGLQSIPEESPHAVTIPGAVDAWCALSADHGRRGIEASLAAAIDAAETGYVVTPRVAFDWSRFSPRLKTHQDLTGDLLPGGRTPETGQVMRNPALAATLRRIATEGRKAFYEGEVAEDIVATLRDLGGVHEIADFESAQGDYMAPISTEYRGYRLVECPPNGQGIVALLIAGILSRFELSSSRFSQADRVHLLAEATKAAYRRRDAIVADPDISPIDIEAVLSSASIDALAEPITLGRALAPETWDIPEHRDTVYVSVVDGDGMAVSLINSIFSGFGSGIYAKRSGVLLHNRGSGFCLARGHPNALAPRKRPLHTIIPGLLTQGDRVVMSFGVMGGHYQATGHAQMLMQLLDLGAGLQAASDAPRSFAFGGTLELEPTFDPAIGADLESRGHKVVWAKAPIGGCQAIWIDHDRGVLIGASDHRKDGIALGY